MITFNDLRINEDKDRLYIDCMVDSEYESKDVWIDSIQLVYYNNILSDGLIKDRGKVVTVYPGDGEDSFEEQRKFFAGSVTLDDLSVMSSENEPDVVFDKGLFYVIVTCDGTEVPEDYQDFVVVPDWEFIYSVGMPFVAQLAVSGVNKCDFPAQFEEFTVIWYALQLAFATCEFSQVELLWNRFLRFASTGEGVFSACPCNQ